MARIPDYVKVLDFPSGRRYEVRVEVTGPGGRRKQSRMRFTTLKDAIDHYTSVTSGRSRGVHVGPNELTVRQSVEDWLASQRLKPKAVSAYVTALRPVVDHLGDRRVQTVTKGDIESVVTALREGKSAMGTWKAPTKNLKNAKKVRSPWAPASINPMLAHLRSVFNDLMEQGVVVRNPAALVKNVPTSKAKTKSKIKPLTSEQADAFLKSTRGEPFYVGYLLALYGMRRGEILGLRWKDVDFTAKTVSINRERIAVDGGSMTDEPKTESSVRTLPMPDDLAAALRAESKRQKELRLQLGNKWPDSGYVVAGALGEPPHPDTFYKKWSSSLKAAGLDHVRLHDARHTCATLMTLNGTPPTIIAAWLGHVDAKFTMSVYSHPTQDGLAEAGRTLSNLIHREDEGAAKTS